MLTLDTSPGARLGPYEIVSRIGAGGMGEVFHARDTRLDRSVAIKVLPAEVAQNAQFRQRFEREAKTISQLNHPHICTLHDVGDGYLVMELLDGESLAERLVRGPLPLKDVMRYGIEIASALDRAHRAGVVHRDLKPGNVMITKSGAKLLDFGLAKSNEVLEIGGDMATQHKPLTQEGTILGTFQYMAPEQLEGTGADSRTDIFALGALLYEMATGARAFDGKTKTSLIAAIVERDPAPITSLQPLAPPALEHVISKCLAKDPDDRWQSAHDIAEEPESISFDGRELLVILFRKETGADLAIVSMSDGRVRPFAQTEADEPTGTFSPDGKWIAYESDESGRAEVYVRSSAGTPGRWQISTDGGGNPRWVRGSEIIFQNGPKLMSVTVQTQPAFSAAPAQLLVERALSNYDVAADGRILIVEAPDATAAPGQMNVVLNWFEEVRSRSGATGK